MIIIIFNNANIVIVPKSNVVFKMLFGACYDAKFTYPYTCMFNAQLNVTVYPKPPCAILFGMIIPMIP